MTVCVPFLFDESLLESSTPLEPQVQVVDETILTLRLSLGLLSPGVHQTVSLGTSTMLSLSLTIPVPMVCGVGGRLKRTKKKKIL